MIETVHNDISREIEHSCVLTEFYQDKDEDGNVKPEGQYHIHMR